MDEAGADFANGGLGCPTCFVPLSIDLGPRESEIEDMGGDTSKEDGEDEEGNQTEIVQKAAGDRI